MRVTVEYFGQARTAVGLAREEITSSAASVQEMLLDLARNRGGRFAALLLDGAHLSASVVLAVDDQQINNREYAPLKDGTTITVIPPISGGQR